MQLGRSMVNTVHTSVSGVRGALCTPVLVVLVALLAPATAHGSRIALHAQEYPGGAGLDQFTYLVNIDNARDPHAGAVLDRTGVAPTESNSPIVAEGDQGSATTPDLAPGRYLISVRSPSHKLWGKHVTIPAAEPGDDRRDGGAAQDAAAAGQDPRLRVRRQRVDQRRARHRGGRPRRASTSRSRSRPSTQVSVDYFNHPLCGGDCLTENDGFVADRQSRARHLLHLRHPARHGM